MATRYTVEDMQKIAADRGGKCLSKEYKNYRTKLEWECKEGHRWKALFGNIKAERWCPECGVLKKKIGIEKMHEIAKKKGGKCLSEQYYNNQIKLMWQCKEGHEWGAKPGHIVAGHWCPYCAKRAPLSIEKMQSFAEDKGGKCLSTEYVTIGTKLKWQCKEGHPPWEATPRSVIHNNSWCPTCSGNRRFTIEDVHKIAEKLGIKCLSDEYVNSKTKLKWQCKDGHKFDTSSGSITIRPWCPICNAPTGIHERICRKYFETIFGKKFPKSRPKWLKNEEGNLMELDGYNEELGLAFEYHGRQHFEYVDFFHGNKEGLEKRKRDDELKSKLCEKNNVKLIEISFEIEPEDMQSYIIEQCNNANIPTPEISETISYKLFNVFSSGMLKEMQNYAKSQGGECLSKEYINNSTKLKFRCKDGHVWKASPAKIKMGRWCYVCSSWVLLTIEEMHEIAKSRGGKCLSTGYINNHTKLKWQCNKGHPPWWATPSSIKHQETWCPYCYGHLPYTIEDMKKLASKRGGRCLSKEYLGSHNNLEWQCKKKHSPWKATPNNVRRGTWCPTCAGKKKP